jgi:YVTN family beta-propeller protein
MFARRKSIGHLALMCCAALLASEDLRASGRSSTIAISPDGGLLAAVNNDSRSVTLVELPGYEIRGEIIVGRDPRTVAFSSDGSRAFVTSRRDDSLAVIDVSAASLERTIELCDEPAAVLALEDGHVFVSCYGAGQIAVIDPATASVTHRIEVDDAPAGMAYDHFRDLLYVAHFADGRVSVIDPESLAVEKSISTGADSNLANAIALSPDGTRAWVPHERANVGNEALLFDTTVFPVVTAIDLDAQAQVFDARIHLDISDEPVNMPFDAVITADEMIWVLNSGSNDISVIGLADNGGIAHIEVGDNPRGLALSADEATIYVNNNLSGTVSVIDTAAMQVTGEIRVTAVALTRSVLNGKRLFHSSATPVLARDQWISCATCHFDGEMDSRTWFFPDGPRNTPSLLGVGQTLPVHWSGDLDELQDVEVTVRDLQAGTGLAAGDDNCSPACDQGPPNAGRSQDLDDLAEYMATLEFAPNPNREADGSLSDAAVRGKVLFESEQTQCATCHAAPLFTDRQRHEVGTGGGADERKGAEFDTPSLRGIYKTPPYLHDGRAETLLDVLTTNNPQDRHGGTSHLSEPELADLVAYLESLGGEASGFVMNAGLNDAWLEAGKTGQGFFIVVYEKVQQVFLAWFTYDAERPGEDAATLGEPGHRWLTAQGPFEGNRAELDITLTEGGVFASGDPAVTNSSYGTLVLEFNGCNSGTVTYRIPDPGREGVIPLERIAGDNLARCKARSAPD